MGLSLSVHSDLYDQLVGCGITFWDDRGNMEEGF